MTRYEIAARHPDGRHVLISYSPRLSRAGLLAAISEKGALIVAKLGLAADAKLTACETKPRPHVEFEGGLWIGFTGRTQLDATNSPVEKPLPFIGSLA